MCAAAAYWGGIRRVVYAIDAEQVRALTGGPRELTLTCREVFARGREAVEVIGPALADEAGRTFQGES
jgi:tRNA(Arg) A34 adenosine deaminase TadA